MELLFSLILFFLRYGNTSFSEKFATTSGNTALKDDERVYKAASLTRRKFISIDPDADIKYESGTLRGDSIVAVVGKCASMEYLQSLQ